MCLFFSVSLILHVLKSHLISLEELLCILLEPLGLRKKFYFICCLILKKGVSYILS